jgi:hypothetical protein
MRLRYFFLAFFFATGWFIASTEDSAAAGCRAPRDAADYQVNVDVQVGEPRVFNHMSKAELGTTNSHGGERQILGTTQSGFSLRWSINYQVSNWRSVYCFWTSSADVELTYKALDVNIASEYEPGSCQYEAVLDHELEHVQVAQDIMHPFAQELRTALSSLAIPTAHLPDVANTPEYAREEVEEAFRRTLLPVRDQMAQLLATRQEEVDSLENYQRTWARCQRW